MGIPSLEESNIIATMKFGLFILFVLSVKSALACGSKLQSNKPPPKSHWGREMDGLPWLEETLQVLENEFEQIDRALPELELLENRGKWVDALKEYGTMWKDAMKE